MNIKAQKKLALALLDFHGGQGSALYAVGSCMLSDAERGRGYIPSNHQGHVEAIRRASSELRNMKRDAKHPECVSAKDERAAGMLADKLDGWDVPKHESINGVRFRCYVLPGSGFDRWTVVYVDQRESAPGTFACVGMSGHSSAMLGKHLGKRVWLSAMPESLRAVVAADCSN